MPGAICHDCIDDAYLKAEVLEAADIHRCSECGLDGFAISVEDLGKRMEPILRILYAPGADNGGRDEQRGESLSDIVQEALGKLFSVHDEIVEAIAGEDDYWPPDGGEPYWDDTYNYEFRTPSVDPADIPDWQGAADELKHGMRFFSKRAKQLFDSVFDGVDSLEAFEDGARRPVIDMLPPGTKIYRARTVASDALLSLVCNDPAAQVGPPPASAARGGRMNAEGVAVLYAALDEDTCIAEMRPAIGSDVAMITLETTRQIRILDFKRLENTFKENSIFDPEFGVKQHLHIFQRRLHRLIARPITPGNEFDYIITQTMAEYLACVHKPPVNGIKFGSAQREGGINIVLLPGNRSPTSSVRNRFGVAYEPDSLRFSRISAVRVEHDTLHLRRLPSGEPALASYDEYDDFYEN